MQRWYSWSGRNKQAIKGVHLLPLNSFSVCFCLYDFVREAAVFANTCLTADRNVCM